MKRAICELTGKPFDCKNCKHKDDCAIWAFDDSFSKLMKQIREDVTEALNENK
jgi:hypothetical protein